MNGEKLTLEAKEAIRNYMIRLVAIPGFLGLALASILGFLINDIAKEVAFNEAYREATDRVMKHTEDVWAAARAADEQKERVEALVKDIEAVSQKADELSAKLNSFKAISETEELVHAVATDVVNRSDFGNMLAGEIGDRVQTLESTLGRIAQGSESCSWETVGYDKSHGHNMAPWCPSGTFIRQFDIDGCSSGENCPEIGRVHCCSVLSE